jgi:hypothetical protein
MLGRGGSWVNSGGGGGGGSTYVRSTRFISIGASTSGTLTKPTNSTIILDDFGGTVDAVAVQISGGRPLKSPALDALGSVIAATLDTSGNWTLSGTPAAYPIALVYRVRQAPIDYDDTASDIWGDAETAFAQTGQLGISLDGGGAPIVVGTYGFVRVPFDCTIVSAETLADQSGSISVDVWKKAYSGFPPASGDKISASAPMALSSAQKNVDTTLTGWTVALKAGDILSFNVSSVTTCTRVNLYLGVSK